MIGCFCHYLPIYKDINGNYCSTTLNNTLFKRYFRIVDKLYVLTRVYEIDISYEEAHQEKIDLDGVEIIEFPNLSSFVYLSSFNHHKKRIQIIIDKCDFVFIRGGLIANIAAEYSRKIKKPYLVECAYCSWDDYWNHGFIGKIVAPFMEIQQKRITKNAAFVIYVTESWLQKRYPTNGNSTYASNVYLPIQKDFSLDNRFRKNQSIDTKKIVVGTIGGVDNKAKGHKYVLKAMSILKKKYGINIFYEAVGSGSGDYLKKIAQNKRIDNQLNLKKQLTHEEILNWLDYIDLYIQPSLQEGLPRSLIEAMSRGCLCIGSSTAGIPELLEHQFVFKRKRVKQLVKRILQIINSANKNDVSSKNYKKSLEYNLEDLDCRRNKIYDMYLEAIKNRIHQ